MSESSASTLSPGTVLENKWIIIELIGKGAMGEVYRAHQRNLKRDVAIKIISQEVLAIIEGDLEELNRALGRFQREVQAMAQVRHPNVLTIYDYGEIPDADDTRKSHTAYIAMEYIPGNTLRFTMDEDGQDDDPELLGQWVSRYYLPLLDGVEVLHAHAIVHRDLKPENIFMDGEVPKIADFGLSRSFRMKALTCSVDMLGTLAYMSPEQCADFKRADFKSDVYALGKMLYEAARGTLTEKTLPFTTVSLEDPTNDFLKALNTVLLKATKENPDDRYQSVQELRTGIKEALAVLEGKKPLPPEGIMTKQTAHSKVSSLFGWAIAAIVILGAAALALYHLVDRQALSSGEPSPLLSLHLENRADTDQVLRIDPGEIPPPTMLGKDGSRMMLTSTPDAPEADGLFYVDEEKTSNFLFVEFLNNLGDAVTVEQGVVRFDEQIIFYIGGSPDEAPIVYLHNTFHLSDQGKGIEPVVRVTYHGASLFAAVYGKSLLTGKEWLNAYRFHSPALPADTINDQATEQPGFMAHMQGSPASRAVKEDDDGAVHRLGMEMKEWVRIEAESGGVETVQQENAYDSGIMNEERARENKPPLRRLPWEGFGDVGFRTKIAIQQE